MKTDLYVESYTKLIQSQEVLEESVLPRFNLSGLFLDRGRVFLLLFHQSTAELLEQWNNPSRAQLPSANPDQAHTVRRVINLAVKGKFLEPLREPGREIVYVPAFALSKYPLFNLLVDSEALQVTVDLAAELAQNNGRFGTSHFILAALIQRGLIARSDAIAYLNAPDQDLAKFLQAHGQDHTLIEVCDWVLRRAVRAGQAIYVRKGEFASVDGEHGQALLPRRLRITTNHRKNLLPNLKYLAEALDIPADHEGRLIDPARAWLALFGSREQQIELWFDPQRNEKLSGMPGYQYARSALRDLAGQTTEFKPYRSLRRAGRRNKEWWAKAVSTAQTLGGVPALTSAQVTLLVACEQQKIDEATMKSLWNASPRQIRNAVDTTTARRVATLTANACHLGNIVRVSTPDGRFQYTTPEVLAQHPEWTKVDNIRLGIDKVKAVLRQMPLDQDRVITPDRFAGALRAEGIGQHLDAPALQKLAAYMLTRLARNGDIVRIDRGKYMTPEDAQARNITPLASRKRLSVNLPLLLRDLRAKDSPTITVSSVAARLKHENPALDDQKAVAAARALLSRAFREGQLLNVRRGEYILPDDKAQFPKATSYAERKRSRDPEALLSFVPQNASPRVTIAHLSLLMQAAQGRIDKPAVEAWWEKLETRAGRKAYYQEFDLKTPARIALYPLLEKMVNRGYLQKEGDDYLLPTDRSITMAR